MDVIICCGGYRGNLERLCFLDCVELVAVHCVNVHLSCLYNQCIYIYLTGGNLSWNTILPCKLKNMTLQTSTDFTDSADRI